MKRIKTLLSFMGLLAIIAVVLLMDIPTFMKIKRGQIKDFNTVAAGKLKEGDPVKGTIDTVLGACAEQYSTKFGIRTSSDSKLRYYVLWMDNEQLILYETGDKEEYSKLEKISDETADYFDSMAEVEESGDIDDLRLPTTTMEFEGVVRKPTSEIMDYFKEYYGKMFESDFASRAEKVMISHREFSQYTVTMWIGLGCAVLCVVLGVVAFILWRKQKKTSTDF